MSIVCCKVEDGKIQISSDSITVRGYTQQKNNQKYSKLTQLNNMTIGGVGTCEETSLFLNYMQCHTPKDSKLHSMLSFVTAFSKYKKELTESHKIENHYILIFQNKAFTIQGFFVAEIKTYEAIGAGMDYALATLYLGHDTKKAVETACELSIFCEKPIVHYEIPTRKKS